MKIVKDIFSLALMMASLALAGCSEIQKPHFYLSNVALCKNERGMWVRADVSERCSYYNGFPAYEIKAVSGSRERVLARLERCPDDVRMEDANNDGYLDLIVERQKSFADGVYNTTLSFINDGNGDFSRVIAMRGKRVR